MVIRTITERKKVIRGRKGERGIRGASGAGLPLGGSEDQVPVKASATNFDIEYRTLFDGLNKITVSATEPTSPTVGDLWVELPGA